MMSKTAIRTVTTRQLEIYLKRGFAAEELATKLGFDSPGSLYQAMKRSFSNSTYGRLYKRIQENTRKKEKQEKRRSGRKEPENGALPVTQVTEEKVDDSRIPLAELLAQEKAQQIATADQEVVLKGVTQEYRELLGEVSITKTLILAMQQKIHEAIGKAADLESRAEGILSKHSDELKKLHEEQAKLEALRSEIRVRTIVSVFVYEETIEAEQDGNPFELKYGNWEKLYKDLIGKEIDELFDNLTFKQIRLLAKILSLSTDEVYEISFESEEVEKVYDSLRES